MISNALFGLGLVAQAQGNYQMAHKHHKHSLTIRRELLDKRGIAYSLIMLAHLASEKGSLLGTARAVRLLSYSSALFASINAPMNPIFLAVYDHVLVTCRAKLAEATLVAAWNEGQAMTLAKAIAYAMEEDGGEGRHAPKTNKAQPRDPAGLR